MNKVFLTSGSGNALFQISHFNDYSDVEFIPLLDRKNWVTNIIRWSIHKSIIQNVNYSRVTFLDFIALLLLFLKFKLIRGRNDFANIELGGIKYHFGYYQFQHKINHQRNSKLTKKYVPITDVMSHSKCVIHIRNGDFAKKNYLDVNFYITAIKLMNRRGIFDFELIGFDHQNMANALIKECPNSRMHVSEGTELEDFCRLFNATNIISSNSTFCIWASIYGASEVVVAPHINKKIVKDILSCEKIKFT